MPALNSLTSKDRGRTQTVQFRLGKVDVSEMIIQENQKEEAESLLLVILQADRLEQDGDEIGADFAANELEGGNKCAVQADGMADHLIHPSVGRFFARGSTSKAILFCE